MRRGGGAGEYMFCLSVRTLRPLSVRPVDLPLALRFGVDGFNLPPCLPFVICGVVRANDAGVALKARLVVKVVIVSVVVRRIEAGSSEKLPKSRAMDFVEAILLMRQVILMQSHQVDFAHNCLLECVELSLGIIRSLSSEEGQIINLNWIIQ